MCLKPPFVHLFWTNGTEAADLQEDMMRKHLLELEKRRDMIRFKSLSLNLIQGGTDPGDGSLGEPEPPPPAH